MRRLLLLVMASFLFVIMFSGSINGKEKQIEIKGEVVNTELREEKSDALEKYVSVCWSELMCL